MSSVLPPPDLARLTERRSARAGDFSARVSSLAFFPASYWDWRELRSSSRSVSACLISPSAAAISASRSVSEERACLAVMTAFWSSVQRSMFSAPQVGPRFSFGPLGEGVVVAAALVGVAGGGGGAGEVLDGRVPLHAKLLAEILLLGAIHISDDNRLAGLVLVSELVPSGFHRLAVASPRREELDESSLAGFENLGIEVLCGEVDGAGVGADHQAHQGDREERDTHLDRKRAC